MSVLLAVLLELSLSYLALLAFCFGAVGDSSMDQTGLQLNWSLSLLQSLKASPMHRLKETVPLFPQATMNSKETAVCL